MFHQQTFSLEVCGNTYIDIDRSIVAFNPIYINYLYQEIKFIPTLNWKEDKIMQNHLRRRQNCRKTKRNYLQFQLQKQLRLFPIQCRLKKWYVMIFPAK